jgi:hypothetical protein
MMYREVKEEELSTINSSHWSWDEAAHSCWAVFDGRSLIAGLRIFRRTLVYNDISIPVAGIGGLITIPERRGFGVASSLINFVCNNEDPGEFVGFVANSKRGDCVFSQCGFVALAPSSSARLQDLYWRSMGGVDFLESPIDVYLAPGNHF